MKKKLFFTLLLAGVNSFVWAQVQTNADLYNLNTSLESRSISFENPTGEPGEGGKAASNLGVGRKGAPCKFIKAHE